ncbi:unnamed protein product [Alopecurus aequalis]
MRRRRWSDLPADLLRQIAGSLHVASDFVRFHAVCKPWRRSHKSTSARKKTTTDQFLPWLLAPNEPPRYKSLKLRCVFSKCTYLPPGPPPAPPSYILGRNWVGSADGTAVCYFSSDPPAGPTLHGALTGAALAQLPIFLDDQWEVENPRGIIYKDGAVLLYSTRYGARNYTAAEVRVALLRPGDDAWTVIRRTLDSPNHCEVCVAYHAGKILVTVQRDLWHVIPLAKTPAIAINDALVRRPSSMPPSYGGYYCEHGHVLESRGELLWALMHMSVDFPEECRNRVKDIVGVLAVSVHALEENDPAAPQWVRKEGESLADRVLFLGWPNSFAVDAKQLGVNGGFAYFMYDVADRRGVFKYDLINKRTDFVDWLPKGWKHAMCTWLIPQPVIAPIRQNSATTPRRNNII